MLIIQIINQWYEQQSFITYLCNEFLLQHTNYTFIELTFVMTNKMSTLIDKKANEVLNIIQNN